MKERDWSKEHPTVMTANGCHKNLKIIQPPENSLECTQIERTTPKPVKLLEYNSEIISLPRGKFLPSLTIFWISFWKEANRVHISYLRAQCKWHKKELKGSAHSSRACSHFKRRNKETSCDRFAMLRGLLEWAYLLLQWRTLWISSRTQS